MTTDQDIEVLEMYDAGIRDMQEFTTNTDLSETAVRKILRAYGRTPDINNADAICKDYQSDMPVKDVLGKWHLNPATLYTLLDKKGVPIRAVAVEAQGVTETRKQTAVAMYNAGAKVSSIYVETGISPSGLYAELEKLGMPNRSTNNVRLTQLNKAVKMYIQMETLSVVYVATGVTSTVLYKALAIRGIAKRGYNVDVERLDKAVEMYCAGIITNEIALKTGVSPTTLYHELRIRGVALRGRNTSYPVEQVDMAVDMYRKGHTLGLIYDKTRIPSKALYQILVARGFELRP